MASAPTKTTTVKTVNNNTGVTTSTSTTSSSSGTTVTKKTTIGTPKTTTAASSVSTPAAAPAAALAAKWITGPNDDGWTMCAPVAVANTLLAATGIAASNAEIERLYRAAGGIGDTGIPLTAGLDAAVLTGLAGCHLDGYWPTDRYACADLLLMFVTGVPGLHVAAYHGGKVITWGGEIPLDGMDAVVLGAWSLHWHGTETR